MPIYNFMVFEHAKSKFLLLEALCRQFLWGTNLEGRDRIPLIAWEKITRRKEVEGLGFTSLQEMSLLLKIRHLSCILEENNSAWIAAASEFVRWGVCKVTLKKETCNMSI